MSPEYPLSAWLPNNRIVGLLKLKVRKILDTTLSWMSPEYSRNTPAGISLEYRNINKKPPALRSRGSMAFTSSLCLLARAMIIRQ